MGRGLREFRTRRDWDKDEKGVVCHAGYVTQDVSCRVRPAGYVTHDLFFVHTTIMRLVSLQGRKTVKDKNRVLVI